MNKNTSKLYPAKIVNSRMECARGEQLPDGRIIVVWLGTDDPNYFLHYDAPFLLDGEVTTLNKLIETVGTKSVACFDEYTITPNKGSYSKRFSIRKVIAEFKEHGFNVTKEAIYHNYYAWLADEKSGYRDEVNGYHLFTPCGCNPLSFRLSTLSEKCDWQTTYCC